MLALSLGACAVKPAPLTTGAVSSFASDKLARVTRDQEPVTQAITLYEAMARAVKYNLDFHVELYNEVLASQKLQVARLETLPSLAANAYWTNRNNNDGGRTSILFRDKSKFAEDVSLSWNVLDLGLSYVRAQQAADEVLIAEERRRKIINRIIEDVRTAYFRAVSADKLMHGLRRLEGRVRKSLADAKALERDGLTSPLTALTYQRELVEIEQRIQRLEKDLSLAKIQLAALMNVKPDENFTLAAPARSVDSTDLPLSADEMVHAAMENRPEIRDIQYQLRINAKEGKAALLQLLPSANIFATANWDSDSYLLNSNWVGWGAKASWNALNVFKYPAKKKLIGVKDEVLDQRALAITMAIMTQVHVSRVRYAHSRKLYITAAKHLKVQKGIRRQLREAAAENQASEQTLIREEMNTLASEVQADIAYADLQNAYANIFASMGLDPYGPEITGNESLDTVASSLEALWVERGDHSGIRRARASARTHALQVSATDAIETGSTKAAAKTDPVVTGSVKSEVVMSGTDAASSSSSGWQPRERVAKPRFSITGMLKKSSAKPVETRVSQEPLALSDYSVRALSRSGLAKGLRLSQGDIETIFRRDRVDTK